MASEWRERSCFNLMFSKSIRKKYKEKRLDEMRGDFSFGPKIFCNKTLKSLEEKGFGGGGERRGDLILLVSFVFCLHQQNLKIMRGKGLGWG